MTEETVLPILETEETPVALGRRADVVAAGLAGLGAGLSILAALWFFLGFAENDTRPEHLASALALTLILFAFAIVPFLCVTFFARRAFKMGTRRAHLFWTLFLMLPWIGLGSLSAIFTPLPIWTGLTLAGLAALLSLWAGVSLVLDWNATPVNTLDTRQNEVPVTPE